MIYTVQSGDTLSSISLKLLGTAAPAATLFEINKSKIKSGSPSQLTAGEQLIIPEQMIRASQAKGAKRTPNEVLLEVNGLFYAGWKSVQIQNSLETASGAFNVEVFDKWEPGAEPWPIFDQDAVKVWIGEDLVINGYVDEVSLGLSASGTSMEVAGRDRTGDLVDCSALNLPGTWKGKKLERIAADIAAPFGVKVIADVDTGPAIPVFALLPGEKAFAAIDRGARSLGLITTKDVDGSLLITLSGTDRADDSVVEGVNLLDGHSKASCVDRFSDYVVLGQGVGTGKVQKQFRGQFRDEGVTRYRSLMLIHENRADAALVNDRARAEAQWRAAKEKAGTVTVKGWRQTSGALWVQNQIVAIDAPSLALSGDHLITSVQQDISENGLITVLTLARPDAYELEEALKADRDILKVRRFAARNAARNKKRGGQRRAPAQGFEESR